MYKTNHSGMNAFVPVCLAVLAFLCLETAAFAAPTSSVDTNNPFSIGSEEPRPFPMFPSDRIPVENPATKPRTVTDFSHLFDAREEAVFVTVQLWGKPNECQASIIDAHTIPNKPAHPWYPIDMAAIPSDLPIRNLTKKDVPVLRSTTPRSKTTRYFMVTIDAPTSQKPQQAFAFQDPREMHAHDMMAHVDKAKSPKAGLPSSDHHHGHGDDEAVHEVVYAVESATQNVYFPAGVRSALLYCDTANSTSAIALDIGAHMGSGGDASQNRRRFMPSDANGIEVRSINEVAPPTQTLSIVFVSGGFMLEDKETFFKNATDLFAMLQDPGMDTQGGSEDGDLRSMHRSVPHNRYVNFWNVYAVFQPSVERGASRPGLPKQPYINVDNNLGCEHPAQIPRGLACRWELAQSLADVSPAGAKDRPAKTLVISIVNTPLYGGTGQYLDGLRHFGNFFNGYNLDVIEEKKRMLSLMDHECGHAYGGLADEYIAITGDDNDDEFYENCQMGSGSNPPNANSRWKWWMDAKAADPSNFVSVYGNGVGNPNWGISTTPIQECFYNNYFRPNENCMMNRLNDYFMCPVCREAAAVNIVKNRFSLLWPRYPLEDDILVASTADVNISGRISTNTTATLHLSRYLTAANDFTVTAVDHDGTPLTVMSTMTCPACIEVTPAMWSAYPKNQIVYISVSVVDNSKFISSPTKRGLVDAGQFSQTGSFRLMVVDDVATAQAYATANNGQFSLNAGVQLSSVGKTTDDVNARFILCVSVTPGVNATCNMSFPTRLYEAATDINGELSKYDTWVFAIMGGLGAIFIGLWICACGKFSNRSKGIVRPIFRTSFNMLIQLVRILMMMSAVGFMVAAFAALILSSYYYTKLSVLGKVVIVVGIVMAILLYILAFVGFWSVYSRSKRMLCINLLCLVIAIGALIAVTVLVKQWTSEIQDPDSSLNGWLTDWWRSEVKSDPERICGIQNELQCSGYAMFNHSCATVVGSSPECPANCEETNARWFSPCQLIIKDWIVSNSPTVEYILEACLALLGVGIFFDVVTWIALRSMKLSIQRGNTQRVKKVSQSVSIKDDSRKKYASILLLMSLDSRDTVRLKKEFARIDKDQSGTLDQLEMMQFLKKSLMHTPTREEISEIFAICDIDGDKVIDLREFLALFQHSASSQDKYSKIMHQRLAERGLLRKEPLPSLSPISSPTHSRTPSPTSGQGGKATRKAATTDIPLMDSGDFLL